MRIQGRNGTSRVGYRAMEGSGDGGAYRREECCHRCKDLLSGRRASGPGPLHDQQQGGATGTSIMP